MKKAPLITREQAEKEITRLKKAQHANRISLIEAEIEGIYVLLEEVVKLLSHKEELESLKQPE